MTVGPFDDDVRLDARAAPDRNVRADDGVGPDVDVGVDLRRGIDDRARVDQDFGSVRHENLRLGDDLAVDLGDALNRHRLRRRLHELDA